ncbi:MAG TPA: hypothetical protein VLO09_04350 [Ornithinimicrobium sp.]|nr:hypothetical protein [Ornithinimicrobium sp.]
MSDEQSSEGGAGPDESEARQQAADYVVERAESWDEGARPETVREDLEEGLSQAQVDVEEGELDRMAEEIHDRGSTESPDVG